MLSVSVNSENRWFWINSITSYTLPGEACVQGGEAWAWRGSLRARKTVCLQDGCICANPWALRASSYLQQKHLEEAGPLGLIPGFCSEIQLWCLWLLSIPVFPPSGDRKPVFLSYLLTSPIPVSLLDSFLVSSLVCPPSVFNNHLFAIWITPSAYALPSSPSWLSVWSSV